MSGVREAWAAGKAPELEFWRRILTTRGGEWPDDFRRRIDPGLPLAMPCLDHLRDAARLVRVLDVGAGPLTLLGKVWPGHRVELTAVDALAEGYDALLAEAGLVPLVRTRACESERLLDRLPADHFDLVYAQNTLDHAWDPAAAIQQMVSVARPGGVVFMGHYRDEAEREGYSGFHQWNFRVEAGEPVVWRPGQRRSLREITAGRAELIELGPDPDFVAITLRRLA